jgi:plastocyanin
VPIAISTGTIETALPDMLAGEYAIGIGASDAGAAPVVCGEIANIAGTTSGDGAPDELVLGLRAGKSSRNAGVAILREDGDRTAVMLYLLDPVGLEGALAAPAETRTIEIANDENNEWIFTPTSLQIAVGAAVVWENSSDAAHTVSGDSLAFEDSGLLEPGQSFSQIFAEPGTYHFRCAPHPWMEGTIVVS